MVRLSWRERLTGDEAAGVRAVLAAATLADGQPPVSEAVRLAVAGGGGEPAGGASARGEPAGRGEGGADGGGGGGGAGHLLARVGCAETAGTQVQNRGHAGEGEGEGEGGAVVGYAYLDGGGTGELVVHPEHRGRGVGGELAGALLARAGGRLRVWAHGEHPAAARLARRHGLTAARELWRMRRGLTEPLDEPRLPPGVLLRPFRPGADERAFVEVNNRAFDWHPEQGGWDVEQVLRREAQPWFDPAGFLLAVAGDGTDDGGRLLGFHWTKRHSAELGEVYVLGVDPAEHGRGLGAALTLAGLRHLRDRGASTVMLYVEATNAPAIRTYERLGFTRWDADVLYAAP